MQSAITHRIILVLAIIAVTSCGSVQGAAPEAPGHASSTKLAQWKHLSPLHAPLARDSAGIAFDESSHTIILTGGETGCSPSTTYFSDTWAWNGSDWTELHPKGIGPAQTVIGEQMAYDPLTHTAVAVTPPGGCGQGTFTWTWNGSTWNVYGNCFLSGSSTEIPCPMTSPRLDGLGYDAATRQLVYFDPSGYLDAQGNSISASSTWTWSGTTSGDASHNLGSTAWNRVAHAASPTGNVGPVTIVYDAALQKLLMYASYTGTMYAWSGHAWSTLSSSPSPSPRTGSTVVYDPALGGVVLFGGATTSPSTDSSGETVYTPGSPLNDTWLWSGSSWHRLDITTPPGARFYAQAAYDPGSRALVLFGGARSLTADSNDTWELLPPQ